ncbi:MAG: alpha/beta hydrolase [Pseudomonadota bacterium]
MRLAAITALALALCGSVAVAQERAFPVEGAPVLNDRYPRQAQEWPGGVTSQADVVYSTIPGYRPMIVDIYQPPREAGPKPLILFIHGGGWVGGHTRHCGALGDFPATLAALAAEGFVVASLEYRLAREASFPAQVQDARAALRFLHGNAAHYGIEPARTGVWGGSAGGHLSALTALSCGVTALDLSGESYATGSECVQAAAIWYGVFDFGALAAGRPGGTDASAALLLGCSGPCDQNDYALASPVTYLDPTDPPFLLIHGEGDRTVPVQQSRLAEAAMREAGIAVEAIYIPGVDHSFIGTDPATTTAATLRATNATFDFFHRVLDQGANN